MTKCSNLNVAKTHPDYDDNIADWDKIDNVINSKCEQYLRDVACLEPNSEYGKIRQANYNDGAVLHNFTKYSRDGMQGAIFQKAPVATIPDQLKYLIDDVDGNGLSLEQQAAGNVDQTLRKGRSGLLVDMPKVEDGKVASVSDMESGKIAPRIQKYNAQTILNWKTKRVGSVVQLYLIVLSEDYETESSAIFDSCELTQYRVLGLDETGYYQQVYRDSDDKGEPEKIYIRQNGALMDHIPFYFTGSENNDYKVDAAPLLTLAELNIGHYRNSADTEDASFQLSQAMLILALGENIDQADWNEKNPNGVVWGSNSGLNVGSGGSASVIQAKETSLSRELMKDKEQQAVQVGGRLINPSIQITAESARIQQSASVSQLSTIADNNSDSYTSALKECAAFLGLPTEDISYKLNSDFMFGKLTAQERQQIMAEVQMGQMPALMRNEILRKTGDFPADWDDERINGALSDQGPQGI